MFRAAGWTVLVSACFAAPAAGVTLLQDPEGDVAVEGTPVGGPIPANLDLIGLDVEESAEALTFILRVADIEAQEVPGRWIILFSVGAFDYQIAIRPAVEPGIAHYADIERVDASGAAASRHAIDGFLVNASIDAFVLPVPKERLGGLSGSPPLPGDTLVLGTVIARASTARVSYTVEALPVAPADSMPDTPFEVTYVFTEGGTVVADVRVAPEPLSYFSNGQAAIHAFMLRLTNLGDAERTVRLLPTDEDTLGFLVLGRQVVTIDAGREALVPGWLLVGFPHRHEGTQTATVTAVVDGEKEDFGLGIHFPEYPQPAGHHSTLWLHAVPQDARASPLAPGGFWSAVMNDPREGGGAIPPSATDTYVTDDGPQFLVRTHHYRFPLSPQLAVDLDPDPKREGVLEGAFVTDLPLLDAMVAADVYIRDDSDKTEEVNQRIPMFQTEWVPLGDIDAGAQVPFELVLRHERNADKVSVGPGFNLWINLELRHRPGTLGDEAAPPRVQPSASLLLPLRDIQSTDPTSAYGPFPAGDAPRLARATRVDVAIQGAAQPETTYALFAAGPDADWISGLPRDWDGRPFNFRIDVPADAVVGRPMVAAIVAEPHDLGAAWGFRPLLATVGPSAPPGQGNAATPGLEESSLLDGGPAEEASTGLGITIIVLLVAAVTALRRER